MPLTSLQAIVSPRKTPSQARAQRTLDTLFEAQVYVLTRAVMGAIRSASLEGSAMLDAPEFKDEMVKLAWGMLRREPG